jgi:ribosomal protein S18 acetylase RimI-like enzyme
MHPDIIIRRGQHEDLDAIMDIWYDNETRDEPEAPPRPQTLADYPHLLSSGAIWIAERKGQPIGFSGVVVRSNVAFLTDLFVHPQEQSGGLGGRLLHWAMDEYGDRARCTVSSTDLRALALYTRYGMLPQWPNFLLRAQRLNLSRLPQSAMLLEPANPHDPELITWDAHCSGRQRPEDHRYWQQSEGGIPYWLTLQGERRGYAYIRSNTLTLGDTGTAIEGVRIGPLGGLRLNDTHTGLLATIREAATHADVIRVNIPGPNRSLPSLLDAGFRISYVETFMLNAAQPIFDPSCYISSGSSLF